MEKIKLDVKDKKILFELDVDARISLSSLAKKVSLSREVVTYRLNRMLKNGVIGGFITIINMAKLGYTNYKVYFKLQNVDEKREEEILEYLVKHKYTLWVASCSGRFDLIASIWAKNIVQFNDMLSEMVNKFPNNLSNYDVTAVVGVHHFRRKYLSISKNVESEIPFFGGEPEETPLDKKDLKILSILAKNARQTNLEISKKLNLSDNAVKYKIKKLIKDKIIQWFRTLMPTELRDYHFYKVLLNLQNLTKEKEHQIISFCKYHPNITYLVKCIGKWDMEIDMEVEDAQHFRKVMRETRNKFASILKEYESLLIYKEHKLNYYSLEIKE